jgi:hypothetical protein
LRTSSLGLGSSGHPSRALGRPPIPPRDPIFVLDPKKRFTDTPPLNVTFLDGDLAYIGDPSYPYLT